MYACMYVCTSVHMCLIMHEHDRYVYMSLSASVSVCLNICLSVCRWLYVFMYVCMHVCMYGGERPVRAQTAKQLCTPPRPPAPTANHPPHQQQKSKHSAPHQPPKSATSKQKHAMRSGWCFVFCCGCAAVEVGVGYQKQKPKHPLPPDANYTPPQLPHPQ